MRLNKYIDEQDQLFYKVDQILADPEFKEECRNDKNGNWLVHIENEPLREGIKLLTGLQKKIIYKYFIEEKYIPDIAIDLGITCKEVCSQVSAAKVRLSYYVQAEAA